MKSQNYSIPKEGNDDSIFEEEAVAKNKKARTF
jgi:hypothetical protein